MYTTNILMHLVWGALVLGIGQAQGQSSILGHNGGPGDHLCWNAGTPQALEVRHDGNYPIQWFTDAVQRMMLNPTTSYTINPSFAAQNATGFLGISPNGTLRSTGPGPFSRLHLNDGTSPQVSSYRPWMKNGITSTGNNDQSYIDQKYDGTDITDLVIQSSNNPATSPWGTDRKRFV